MSTRPGSRPRTPARLASVALALALAAHDAATQQVTQLITSARGEGFTSDGSKVFGETFNSGPFVWDQFANLLGGDDIVGISADGTLAAGNIDMPFPTPDEAATWDGLGWTGIGGLPGASPCGSSLSSAYAMSDTGKVVGLAWDGCSASAFQWTAGGGMSALSTVGTSARANAVAANGLIIGGHAVNVGGVSGWYANVWDGNGIETIIGPSGSDVLGFSDNGVYAVGNALGAPMRWDAFNGMLGILPPDNVPPTVPDLQGWAGYATGASDDGRIVVGYYGNILGSVGFVWEEGVGTLAAEEYFANHGITFPKDVQSVTDVTGDGRTFLVNVGGWILGGQDVYRVTLPMEFEDLGFAKSGTHGLPQLGAYGDLTPGSEIHVDLTGALENTSAYLVIGVVAINVPFYGGTLVPGFEAPFGTFIVLPTNGAGEIPLAATWPGGVPSGTDLFFQYWIVDGGGVGGFAASNAVHGEVP